MSKTYDEDRRRFLRNLSRYALLGAIALGTGALAAKKPGEKCVNAGICRGCGAYTDCGLPQALSAKQAGVR